MNNFSDIKIKFIEQLVSKRKDAIALTRIISGYINTGCFPAMYTGDTVSTSVNETH